MVPLASLRFRQNKLFVEGCETRSHEGTLTATQRAFVEVLLQDLARRPRTLRRGESDSVMGLRGTQSGHSSLLGSWADCMPTIFKRHAHVANLFMHELDGAPEGSLGAAAEARQAVIGVLGFDLGGVGCRSTSTNDGA